MQINKKRAAAVVGATAVGLAGAGVAFAFWTSTGSGTGTAHTAAGSSDLTYTTTALNDMYPGDSAQPLIVTVKNNSTTQKEYVNNVTAYITTDKPGCTGADFKLDTSTAASDAAHAVTLGWTAQELGTGASVATSGDTIQFNNTTSNQDACKGATVTLNYASS